METSAQTLFVLMDPERRKTYFRGLLIAMQEICDNEQNPLSFRQSVSMFIHAMIDLIGDRGIKNSFVDIINKMIYFCGDRRFAFHMNANIMLHAMAMRETLILLKSLVFIPKEATRWNLLGIDEFGFFIAEYTYDGELWETTVKAHNETI
jgi:hypothetical protein